jgi:hypothetical protein
MREHADGTGAVDAGGDELPDFDVIPLRRRSFWSAAPKAAIWSQNL